MKRSSGTHSVRLRQSTRSFPSALFSRLARMTGHPKMKSFSYSESHFNDMDVENNEKQEWTHSHEPSLSSFATFAELRSEALELAVRMITAAYRTLFTGESSREELAEIIGNRSYLSGLDADDPRNLRFPSLLPPRDGDSPAGGDKP